MKSTFTLWHHRVLGGIWVICGLVFIGNLARYCSWDEGRTWFAALVGAVYVATSIGFFLALRWARWLLGILVAIAALLFLDMLLMFGVHGNREGVREMLAALAIAGYTLFFLIITSAYRCEELK